ncbi:MAG: hypothetical protein C0506_02870 [Anaerolinea sp.]|nr:hypothetical protein [Anaerolinea sp.]
MLELRPATPTLRRMIPIASSLEAHQKQTNRVPVLAVTASAARFGSEILRWTRYYSGAENDSPHALAIANDGSLVRARNDAGTLFLSRVTSPGSGSTYSSWTNLAAVSAGTGVALASKTGELLLAYVDNAGLTLKVRISTDNGASWAAATTIVTEASAIGSLAAAYNPAGDACLFFTLGTTTTLKRLRRTSGVWAGAGTAWTQGGNVASLTGVAATHDGGDFQLLITGTAVTTTHKRVWGCIMGDGNFPPNAWGSLVSVAESDSLSSISYAGPALIMLGIDIRAAFAHKEAGPVAANRAYLTHPPHGSGISADWAEPAPHEAASAFGLALAAASGAAWATTPSGVWSAPRPASQSLTSRVLSCRFRQDHRGTSCTIELANHDGLLNGAPNANFPALLAGGSVAVSPGYASGAAGAPQFGVLHDLTVSRLSYGLRDGRSTVTLDATGPWEALAHWRAPQAWQTAAAAMTRGAIFARLCARAGVPVTGSGSSDWTTFQPAFAIAAGETGASVAERLLSVASDFLRPGVGLTVRPLAAGDATDASYGAAGEHPIVSLRLSDSPAIANWLRLQGPDRYADSVALAELYQHGPRLRVVRSQDATTDAKANAYAANAARREAVLDDQGELRCPLHAGQELFDVLSITAPLLGVTARKARIIALAWEYRRSFGGKDRRGGARSPSTYESTYTLGGL